MSLNVTNYCSSRLLIKTIECSINGLLPQDDKPQEIETGEKKSILLNLDMSGVDFTTERWVELVVTAVPVEAETATVPLYQEKARFCLSAEPSLKPSEQSFKIVVDDNESTATERREITLAIERGAVQVARIEFAEPEKFPWIQLEPQTKVLLTANLPDPARKQMQVPFRILRKELMDAIGHTFQSEIPLTLVVLDAIRQVPIPAGKIKIQLQYPPKLRVEGAVQSKTPEAEIWTLNPTEVLCDNRPSRMTELRIKVENIGDALLRVEDIHLAQSHSWARLSPASLELGPRNTNAPPSTASLYLVLDGNEARHSRGNLEIEMTLKGGEGTPPAARIVVPFVPKELPLLDGILAIDFGTSSTTWACYTEGERRPKESDRKPSVSTAVFYEDLNERGEPVYVIGEEAIKKGGISPSSLVTEIKRKLGSSKTIEVTFGKNSSLTKSYKPEEIAGHFLLEYRKLVENELRYSVKECIITHPVFFLDSSVTALRRAFEYAGFAPAGFEDEEEGSNILVEPVAAAFQYISQNTGRPADGPKSKEYRLGVFDFGGGTTDFTLIHVRCSYDGKRPLVLANIEEVDGERYGGFDVTLKLAYYLVSRWSEEYKKKTGHESSRILLGLEEIRPEMDPVARKNALSNRREFLEQAEFAKRALSEDSSVTVRLSPLVNPPEQVELAITEADLDKLLRPDIEALVGSFKNMLVAHNATAATRENGACSLPAKELDVIVVSGNSSRLRLVPSILQQEFPGVNIKPSLTENGTFRAADELKEVIVYGLLEHTIIARFPQKRFLLDAQSSLRMPNKLIVTIGVAGYSSGVGEQFMELLDKNTDVPTGWVLVDDYLNRETEIRFLAMGGSPTSKSLYVDNNGTLRWNSRIQPLGSKISCKELGRPAQGWRKCVAEVQVQQNRSVHFRIMQDGKRFHERVLPPEVMLD